MRFLRTNTAVIVTVGPFLDKTDGVTLKTSLTITNEKISLHADTDAGSAPTNVLDNVTGATSGTANDLNYITGQDDAMMQLELAAADVNRLGRVRLTITDAANHLPVIEDFMILPQAIFDWFIAGTIVPLPANVTQLLGTAWLTPATAGTPDVNAKLAGGTALTGRDIGASVLLSSGTGAGQLDFTSGVVKANLAQILGTALTETAGLLAGGFKKFFNIATPAATMDHLILLDTVTTATAASTVSDAPTVATVAAAVMDRAMSSHTTAGTFGDYIRRLMLASNQIVIGTGSDTTHIKFSTVDGAAPSSTDDMYKGRVLVFITGALANQAVSISAYVGSSTTATISAATGSAANGDKAMLV